MFQAHDQVRAHGGDACSPDQRCRLFIALALTGGFALVAALAGWRGVSLALPADAGHPVTDGAAPSCTGWVPCPARSPPSSAVSSSVWLTGRTPVDRLPSLLMIGGLVPGIGLRPLRDALHRLLDGMVSSFFGTINHGVHA